MQDRWIICLGAGSSQVPLIYNAKKLGYSVLAIDQNPEAPGLQVADESLIESTYHAERILEELNARKWIGLLARCTGTALFTAAKINSELSLPGINLELAQIATSKSILREFSSSNGIRMPHGIKVSNTKNLDLREFRTDIIIKPDFTITGKKSIRKLKKHDLDRIASSIEEALLDSGNDLVEIEDFVEGYDCTFLAWIEKGKAYTFLTWDELVTFDDKGTLRAFGIAAPSISALMGHAKYIQEIVDRFSTSFADVRALVAFSFKVDKEGLPWLIEVHADLTGDLILDDLAPVVTGKDLLMCITNLLVDVDSKTGLSAGDWDVAQPAALIYKNPDFDVSRNLIVKGKNLVDLHQKIARRYSAVVLEQPELLKTQK